MRLMPVDLDDKGTYLLRLDLNEASNIAASILGHEVMLQEVNTRRSNIGNQPTINWARHVEYLPSVRLTFGVGRCSESFASLQGKGLRFVG
jgi:hypothetical protein